MSSNAEGLAGEFDTAARTIAERAKVRMARWGAQLKTEIAAKAPGTNYPATIKLSGPRRAGSVVGVEVSTDRPDAFRKERGLHRSDSRGRTYRAAGLQRDGQKHFGPGFAAVAPQFEADMRSLIEFE